MRNPYVIGGAVHQASFYGRKAIIEDLLDTRHQCVYLVGSRRVGKTSLLHYLEDEAPCVSLFLDLEGSQGDPIRMGAKLAKQIRRKARIVSDLCDLPLEPNDDICTVVETLADAAEDRGFQVLLLWDEAEDLLSLDGPHLKRLRASLQDKKPIRTILAATKRLSELNDLCRSWRTSPFLHGFAVLHIPSLSIQEASALICQINNPQGPVDASPELQVQIMDLTGNHPFLTQVLCDRLFQAEGRLRPITDRDLIVDGSLADLFQTDYDALSHAERAIMGKLSELDRCEETELHQALDLETDSLRSYLWSLEQVGYVRHQSSYHQIANHFLGAWWKRGNRKQTPTAVSNQASLEIAVSTAGQQGLKADEAPSSDPKTQNDFPQRAALAKALLGCHAMSDHDTREAIVNNLPRYLQVGIRRSSTDSVDVLNIVNRCLDFPEGIAELIEIVRYHEGDSIGMNVVDELLGASPFGNR